MRGNSDASGWTTPTLRFGKTLTLALGPNGSGKTPLLKGIAYALGHPIDFPPDIRNRCASVILTLTAGGDDDCTLQIRRNIADGLDCTTVDIDGTTRTFSEEKGFSAWIIEQLGIPNRLLSDKGTGVVQPYMSVLVPMFWIDQDLGWRNLYSPLATHNFVKDQSEEVVRWFLDLPSKHRAIDKGDFARAKERHDSLKEQIGIKRNTLTALRRELPANGAPGDREKLLVERESLLAELQYPVRRPRS